jgi:hypothetical protein
LRVPQLVWFHARSGTLGERKETCSLAKWRIFAGDMGQYSGIALPGPMLNWHKRQSLPLLIKDICLESKQGEFPVLVAILLKTLHFASSFPY